MELIEIMTHTWAFLLGATTATMLILLGLR